MTKPLLAILTIHLIVTQSIRGSLSGFDAERKQFVYSLKQEDLVRAEKIFEGRDYDLNAKERVVDSYLHYLRWNVLQSSVASGNFPPMMPIEQVLNEIKSSEIYQLLKSMPKGGILHTHENHQLGKVKLLELFMTSNVSEQLYVHRGPKSNHEWKLELHKSDPNVDGLMHVLSNPQFTIDDLAKQQTMIGALETATDLPPSDSGQRWKFANKIFARGSPNLVVDVDMKRKYLRAMYEQGLSEGIFYFETRKSFTRFERDIELTAELVNEFKQDHPDFLGHRRIYYNKRTDTLEKVAGNLKLLADNVDRYSDHVVGYDLVGDEDWGSTAFHYIDEFLKYIDIDADTNNATHKIQWLFHTAESNWVENVHVSSVNNPDDVMPRSNNLYAALLLGAKRLGHGIGFWKHPYLMDLMKKRKIPVEVCVVSNQLLGYTPDLRNHPGQLLHKTGIPIILSPDDPGLFGYDEVTVDWYEAYVGWAGLNLGDLRQFGINSLMYSGMSEMEKEEAIGGVLKRSWDKYIDDVYDKACSAGHSSGEVKFERMFPKHGSSSGDTNVHIFGFHFEVSLCRKIFCRFGDEVSGIVTEGMYVSNQHLICKAPNVDLEGEDRPIVSHSVYVAWSEETLINENQFVESQSSDGALHPPLRPWMETGFRFKSHKDFHRRTNAASKFHDVHFFIAFIFVLQFLV